MLAGMTWVRLRQVALVAHDLEQVVAELGERLGLRVAHRDPAVGQFGLHNAVLPLGNQFVEVVSPTRPDTAAGRQLARLGGDGGYMVIGHTGPATADHDALRQRVADLGIRVALEYTEPDGYRLLQLHPGDTGGSFLEVDFQPGGDDPDGPWMPAGEHWQESVVTDLVSAIVAVEIRVPDPAVVAARWAEITSTPCDGTTLSWDNAVVRFTDGTGGLVAVECTGPDAATHRIGGIEFRIRPESGRSPA